MFIRSISSLSPVSGPLSSDSDAQARVVEVHG